MKLAQYALTLRMHSRAAPKTLRWVIDRTCSEENTQERCGAILCNGAMVEIPNRHPNPVEHFTMTRADIDNRLHRLVVPVFAWWHTHIHEDNPLPSMDDLDSIGRLTGLVIHCASGQATLYDADGYYVLPC